jgi:hypothetical protein
MGLYVREDSAEQPEEDQNKELVNVTGRGDSKNSTVVSGLISRFNGHDK